MYFSFQQATSITGKRAKIAQENVANWLKANKLNLNAKKSNLLLFNLGRNRKKEKLNIYTP